MTKLNARSRMLITFTFFSMFFGAGNLIFPPFLGAQAGEASIPGAFGFIVSAVGLPILGVVAVSLAGGFSRLANRVTKGFSTVLGVAIMLTIGPCFAIPRTATTSFEMMIVPLTPDVPHWLSQLVYSLVFFAVAFVFARRPEKLSAILGRVLGPLLLAMIAVMFVACLIAPHTSGGTSGNTAGTFTSPTGDYATGQLARGFLDGYQTMDLLAALYFGIVISANIRSMGVSDESCVRRETAFSGVGTGILLAAIYGALTYVGMVSATYAAIDPAHDTGATVLTNLTSALFGPAGTVFVGIVFVIACLNVCTGLISTCGTYFSNLLPTVGGRRIGYTQWIMLFTVFSFVVSNAGLNAIITVSVPVLSALYPIAIVLVALSLTHRVFVSRFPRVYPWAVLLVGIVAGLGCVNDLAAVFDTPLLWLDAALDVLPLRDAQLAWLAPAALGVVIGVIDGLLRPVASAQAKPKIAPPAEPTA